MSRWRVVVISILHPWGSQDKTIRHTHFIESFHMMSQASSSRVIRSGGLKRMLLMADIVASPDQGYRIGREYHHEHRTPEGV